MNTENKENSLTKDNQEFMQIDNTNTFVQGPQENEEEIQAMIDNDVKH